MSWFFNIIFFIFILTFWECSSTDKKAISETIDSLTVNIKDKQLLINLGKRLKLSGDFDGNGVIDTVYESYISILTGKETNKDFETKDYEHERDLNSDNKPISRLYTNISHVDTFIIEKGGDQIGLYILENLGDLNNNNGDELGYIIDLAGHSKLNTYHIISLTKEKKWKELFSFTINESVNYQKENLFNGDKIIISAGQNQIKYKYYSDSATVELGETTLR